MFEHHRFEEFAALAAIGELTPDEQEEFERHRVCCAECRDIIERTRLIAQTAFLAGSPEDQNRDFSDGRRSRLREGIARRLPQKVPSSIARYYKLLVAAGIAAAFVVGAGLGGALEYRVRQGGARTSPAEVTGRAQKRATPKLPSAQDQEIPLLAVDSDLQKQLGQAHQDVRALKEGLDASDHQAVELRSKLDELKVQLNAQDAELVQARNTLVAAQGESALAKESAATSHARIETLELKLADREAKLAEVTASVEREREMLSEGREVRDIMGARDLHIVDVVDRDGKGRPKQAFGRAFYTQGKSLIFYAFDLPTKSTEDGKFVYAAWGSNSNHLNDKLSHSLGIFYNDDRAQHRWAMKFDDPKLLREIDTVFVTLEPADGHLGAPTGKPLLEAYFGTPPNHP